MRTLSIAGACLALCVLTWAVLPSPGKEPAKIGVTLLFHDDFEKGAGRWEPTDPNAWKVVPGEEGKVYSQFRQSHYQPPFRSPLNISLVRDLNLGDFTLEARVKSTVKDYPQRDVCLFFGYQDPGHFYYAHLAKKTDEHANQVFIVNGAARAKISTKTTPGTPWDDHWHRVKVVRTVADGKIEVYFNDMKSPAMTASDRTFTWGRVGVGSFDDTSEWADVTVHGVKAEKK